VATRSIALLGIDADSMIKSFSGEESCSGGRFRTKPTKNENVVRLSC